jgi:hypothetical protein
VCGNIFASPNVAQVRRGIELVTGDKGALVVVMNYTGDALHFVSLLQHDWMALRSPWTGRELSMLDLALRGADE